ncbi:SH3 domain-containing protein [Pseudodonghicola flavimaris]|uniref:SH3 domain-containing protein n=1 Tax=Pseudodonghicola flavimaris TaxID=3050036 RepID=A0ABT7EYC9_9RHOB|nr:SH3 domain-containing protein [Pseudodonghicola flavimaris]MDK3017351.1 SH3 domain-containing protein [Pseudodonghicola flavimaris]
MTRISAFKRPLAAACAVLLLGLGPVGAATDTPGSATAAPVEKKIGPVTHLPLPRYVSLKTDEGNVRRGPSLTHRIDWVFKRRNMPLQITAEHGHWRRVQDRDGAGGWVHYALLSGVRTVLIEQDMTPVYSRPDAQSQLSARFELGVIARLGECSRDWCRISAGGYRGWTLKTNLWGVDADEIRD